MSERDEDQTMNMPRVEPRDSTREAPRVANTAYDEEVTDFKLEHHTVCHI